jgi:Domain of unknown function (DUF397)
MVLTRGWRKASHSSTNGGNCVEVANSDRVAVRDSTDREGPALTFAPEAWRAFTRRTKSQA